MYFFVISRKFEWAANAALLVSCEVCSPCSILMSGWLPVPVGINKEIQTAYLVSSNKMKYCIIFRNVTSFQDIVNKNSLKLLLRS